MEERNNEGTTVLIPVVTVAAAEIYPESIRDINVNFPEKRFLFHQEPCHTLVHGLVRVREWEDHTRVRVSF